MYVYSACLFFVCCSNCVGSVGVFVVSQTLLKIAFYLPWSVEICCVFV